MDQQNIIQKDRKREAVVGEEALQGEVLMSQKFKGSGFGGTVAQDVPGFIKPQSELSDTQNKLGGAFQKVTKLKQHVMSKSPQKENINLKNESDIKFAASSLPSQTFRKNSSGHGLFNPSSKQSPIRNQYRLLISPIQGSSKNQFQSKYEVEMTKPASLIQMAKAVRSIKDPDQKKNNKVISDFEMKNRDHSFEASKTSVQTFSRVTDSNEVLNAARKNFEGNYKSQQNNGVNTIQKIIIRKDQDMIQKNEVNSQIQDSTESKNYGKRYKDTMDSDKKQELPQPNSGEFIKPQGILKTVQDDGDLVMRASPSKPIRGSSAVNYTRSEIIYKPNDVSFQSKQHQNNQRTDQEGAQVLQKRGSSAMKSSPNKVKFKNLRDGDLVNRDLQQLVAMVTSQHFKAAHHQTRKVQIEEQNEKVMTPIVSPDITQIARRFTSSSNQQQLKNQGPGNELGFRRDIAGYIRGAQEMNPQIFSNTPQRNLQNRLTGIGGSASNAYSLAHLSPLQQLPRLAVDKRISEKHMSQQSQESRNQTPRNQQFKQFLGKQTRSPHDYEKISYGSPMRDGQIIEKPYVKNGIFDRMPPNFKNMMSHQKTQPFQSQGMDTPINQYNNRDLTPQKNNKFRMLHDFEGNDRDSNPNYNDPGFSSNTTKKQQFRTTMRGGSVIRSNFKVNEHSVQKNQLSSYVYSKSKQTTSSKNDMGICKQLRFDNEVTPLSLGVNPRDPAGKKHTQMNNKGTHPSQLQPGPNMMMAPPLHPMHPPQAFFDEKYLQGASPYPNYYMQAAAAPFGKHGTCLSPILAPARNPFQTPQSIFGFPPYIHHHQQQHMPYFAGGRYHNQFVGKGQPWKQYQSSKKKGKAKRRKERGDREDERSNQEDSDEPMAMYPYIVHPIVNVGGKIPSQFMQIYSMGRHGAPVSPDKRNSGHKNKKFRHLTPNEKQSKFVEKHQSYKSEQSDTPMDQEMAVQSANSSGIKANRKLVCNSSSKTIKLNKGNESSHKKHKGSDKSMITDSDIKFKQSPDRSINDSYSSSDNSDDDDDSSGSSPQKGTRNHQRMQLLQQQQEANAIYFGENRIRLRMDDGFLTAMPPQEYNGAHQQHLMHQMFYPNMIGKSAKYDNHHQQKQQNSGNSRSGNSSPPIIKQKKGNNNDTLKGSKFQTENRQNRKIKMENSFGTQGEDSNIKSSNNSNSSSTEKKCKIKSSLKKLRKRQRKMEMLEKIQANKMMSNPYLNPFNPNYLANFNPLAQSMLYPPFFGADSPYNNFHLTYRPSYHYGNINILNGYNNIASSQNLTTSQPSYSFLNPTLCQAPSASASPASPSQLTPSPTRAPASQVPGSHLTTEAVHQQAVASGAKDSRRKRRTKQGKIEGKAGGPGARQGLGAKRQQQEVQGEGSDDDQEGVIELKKGSQDEGGDDKGDEKFKGAQYNNNQRKNNNNYYGVGATDRLGSNVKPIKRQKVSEIKNQEQSSKEKSDDTSCFKSPEEKKRPFGTSQNEPNNLFSQKKRSKDKSGRRDKNCFDLNLEQHQQLMLQNMQSFGPALHNYDAEMVAQASDGFGAGISSSQKKRFFSINNQLTQSPMETSQNFDFIMGGGVGPLGGSGRMREFRLHPQQIMDNSNQGHCSSYGQPFFSQSGQKKSKHSGDDFDYLKQQQASISGAIGHNNININGSNAQLNKLFSLSQMTSAEKIQVQKFNQDGAMDKLKDDVPGKRNDIDQIKILNSFQESGRVNGTDSHVALSLSHVKGRKQNGQHQSGLTKSFSFQNSNVKNYPASTSKNLEKSTIFTNGLLAGQTKQMPAPTQGYRRPHGSSIKKVRSSNNRHFSATGGATSTNNAQSSLQTKRLTQEEKEQQNQQNEENIRQKTDQIMNDTVRQDIDGAATQCKRCKCRNTKCLKLYCECLRNKSTCGPECHCMSQGGCHNRSTFMSERRKAVEDILKRNIDAFENKVDQDKNMHFKGCKCKASECQKKYCECFERGVPCTSLCKCATCRNPFGNIAGKDQKHHHHGHADNKCSEAQSKKEPQMVEVSMLEAPTNAIPSFDVIPQSERVDKKITQPQTNNVSPLQKGSKQQTSQSPQMQDKLIHSESAQKLSKTVVKDESQSHQQSQSKVLWESREFKQKDTEKKVSEVEVEKKKEEQEMTQDKQTIDDKKQQPIDQISEKKRIVLSDQYLKEKVKEAKQTLSVEDGYKNEQRMMDDNASTQPKKDIKSVSKPPLPKQKTQIMKPEVRNPEEELILATAQKILSDHTANKQQIKNAAVEESKQEQVQKNVSTSLSGLVKEHSKQKAAQTKESNIFFQDDNCENVNTENIKSAKPFIKGPQLQSVKDSDSRKPKQLRKELALSYSVGTLVTSAQTNVIQLLESSESKKKPEGVMEAPSKPQPSLVKKQVSLQSLDSAKRPLRSKRISEKSTQRETKNVPMQVPQNAKLAVSKHLSTPVANSTSAQLETVQKQAPNNIVTPFKMNNQPQKQISNASMAPPDPSPLPSQTPKAPQLAPKKAQSSQTQSTQNQNTAQKRQQKLHSVSHEKVQTRHQRKMQQKQQMSTEKGQGSGSK